MVGTCGAMVRVELPTDWDARFDTEIHVESGVSKGFRVDPATSKVDIGIKMAGSEVFKVAVTKLGAAVDDIGAADSPWLVPSIADRLDPVQSIRGAARYLQQLHGSLPPEIPEPDRTWMTLAAYNIGLGSIEDAGLHRLVVRPAADRG